MYIALCLTDSQRPVSFKVLEGNIIRHKILRLLNFHSITAFDENVSKLKNNDQGFLF